MRPPNMEQEIQWLKDSCARIGADFTEPDDDWSGAMFFLGEENDPVMFPLLFESDEDKDLVGLVIVPTIIRRFKPTFVGQVQSAWTLEMKGEPPSDMRKIPLPSKHPNRIETLILIGITVDQVQFWSARIIRFKSRPPRLAPWKLLPMDGYEGRFITPIVETLKEVHA